MMRKNRKISQPKKSVFSFVVDGKCELWYLQMLKQRESMNINLEPKLPQKKKLKDQYKLISELSKESEIVFWIVDFDVIIKESKEVKRHEKNKLQEFRETYEKLKKNEKVKILVNNPCLEYWFLLHFEQTSKYYETYDKMEKYLIKYLPDYEKSEKYYKNSRKNIYENLRPYLQTAVANAEKLGKFDFENIHTGVADIYLFFNKYIL
ncbi:MAG: RloB family protein [Prevotellaceae bacterium]|nr:RloB family protein [Prevotellaceae bacterium]